MANSVFISLGGNLGNTREIFKNVYAEIEKKVGPITKKSSIYRTAAWGPITQPDFLNQVLLLSTEIMPENVMSILLEIEKSLGRIREERWGPRVIDLDILFIDDQIQSTELLQLPHPEIANRKFVLIPLNEIAAEIKHPISQKTMADLLAETEDETEVTLLVI
jgi:2-amino-4-hydroxy-6-hydroxymethyldihydropteridine diphosphokinase